MAELSIQSALLVCPGGRGADKLKALMADGQIRACDVAASGSEARRLMSEKSYPMAVINAPLSDESGLELAAELSQDSAAAVVLLVKAEWMSVVFAPATEAGVLVVSKPMNPSAFTQAVQMAAAMHNRLEAMSFQYEKLEKRLEEIRAIDRAKCLLIQHMKLTEEEAHRAIEKQAMDLRLPKARVAKELIRRFEL